MSLGLSEAVTSNLSGNWDDSIFSKVPVKGQIISEWIFLPTKKFDKSLVKSEKSKALSYLIEGYSME